MRYLTPDDALNAAIAVERGETRCLGLAQALESSPAPPGLVMTLLRVARDLQAPPLEHVNQLLPWVRANEGTQPFLLALHKELMARSASGRNRLWVPDLPILYDPNPGPRTHRWLFELPEREHQLFGQLLEVYLAEDSPAVDITATQTEAECGWTGAPFHVTEFAALRQRLEQARREAEAGAHD